LREIIFLSSFLPLFCARPKPRKRRSEIERERERERELNLREIERGRVIVKGWAPYIVKWTAKIAPKQSYPMARTKI
jgi:hypothetical protein